MSDLSGYRQPSAVSSSSGGPDTPANVIVSGADPNGGTDSLAAFQAARTYTQANGGEIIMPAGQYIFSDAWQITGSNARVRGEGPMQTILDFSGAVANSQGVDLYGSSSRHSLSGFKVYGAKAYGLSINRNGRANGTWHSRMIVDDVIIDGCANNNVHAENLYVASFRDMEARNSAAGNGFEFGGFHTNLYFSRCWAGGDAAGPQGGNFLNGWSFNNVTYSSMHSCAADWNKVKGYRLKNIYGMSLIGCGSESNTQEGFYVETDTASFLSSASVVNLQSCFSTMNSKAGLNTYANFLKVATGINRPAIVTIDGCVDGLSGGQTLSVVLNGAFGAVETHERGNNIAGTFSTSGTVRRVGNAGFFGAGSPESVVTAGVGAVYNRTDGGAGTTLYIKESGTGSTGWVAK